LADPPPPLQVTHVFLQRIEEMEREAMDRDQQLTQLAGQVSDVVSVPAM
jgi:hypothetical protein